MDNWWKVIGIVSPFIAAFLAAWITNTYATKRLKAEKFLNQRLDALKLVHSELVAAKLYFSKSINREQGNEHGIWPDGGYECHLILKNLWECFQSQAIFLSFDERESIVSLMKEMDMCNAMERAISSDEEIRKQSNSVDVYQKLQTKSAEALAVLYQELRNEYGI